ncbi:MAG: cytochrome c-type biogenesis protein CcmH [Alphaproteobacteria bacterium]|nr:cytochrome c-type biogenesis protein CcmH [Alphaproteobacteria bacterium]MDE2336762.1 cytochrome c-type biogenesis protein CcmH [Alphaproteobacteria bacterium]
MKRFFFMLALALCLAPAAARAVLPDEMLADHALEKRAEALDAQLRCPVCQGESIADSNADLAHDLRLLVRQRLLKGDTDAQAVQYIVARYGNFVLMDPPLDRDTALLWAGPAIILLAAALAGWNFLRSNPAPAPELSAEEKDFLSRPDDERAKGP